MRVFHSGVSASVLLRIPRTRGPGWTADAVSFVVVGHAWSVGSIDLRTRYAACFSRGDLVRWRIHWLECTLLRRCRGYLALVLFVYCLSLPHDRVQLFPFFFDFGWELFIYPYPYININITKILCWEVVVF